MKSVRCRAGVCASPRDHGRSPGRQLTTPGKHPQRPWQLKPHWGTARHKAEAAEPRTHDSPEDGRDQIRRTQKKCRHDQPASVTATLVPGTRRLSPKPPGPPSMRGSYAQPRKAALLSSAPCSIPEQPSRDRRGLCRPPTGTRQSQVWFGHSDPTKKQPHLWMPFGGAGSRTVGVP